MLENYQNLQNLFPSLKDGNIYLDSAATALTPKPVVEKMLEYYQDYPVNVHRGTYKMSEKASAEYENSRQKVKNFIRAASCEEIIVTKGATEAINLVALSWGEQNIGHGDRILITLLEHHSNILPWLKLAERKGAFVDIVSITSQGEIDLEHYQELLNNNVKLVALTYVSNVIGTILPIAEMVEQAHNHGAIVLVDAAQAAPHIAIDVLKLNCDFLCFSAHKTYGPTGLGILYGKKFLLESMEPVSYGGGMIDHFHSRKMHYSLPSKFEAGTPPIASMIAFGAAIDFLQEISLEAIHCHEMQLFDAFAYQLQCIPELDILGWPNERVGVCSMTSNDIHPHDIGTLLDNLGIMVRVGHHCASPLMEYYKLPATLRVSFGIYNTFDDIDKFVVAMKKAVEIFR